MTKTMKFFWQSQESLRDINNILSIKSFHWDKRINEQCLNTKMGYFEKAEQLRCMSDEEKCYKLLQLHCCLLWYYFLFKIMIIPRARSAWHFELHQNLFSHIHEQHIFFPGTLNPCNFQFNRQDQNCTTTVTFSVLPLSKGKKLFMLIN